MHTRVTREAARHDRLADLALSFPAAIVALATGERGLAQTEVARSLVIAGAPLRAVAQALALPMWLRRLPPQSFIDNVGELPSSAHFAFRIANHMPQRPNLAASWLAWVREAYRACDEEFALWVAREFKRLKRHGDPGGFRVLGMYAWYSRRADLEASRWLAQPWHTGMSFDEACEQAYSWLYRLPFAYCPMPEQPTCDVNAFIDDYRFERLATPHDFIETSEELDNCLMDYAGRIYDTDQIWRVRTGDRTEAAFRLALSKREQGTPALLEASGHANGDLSPAIHRAIYKFLLEWPATANGALPTGSLPKQNLAAYQLLFKPYWLAKGGRDIVPFVDQRPSFPLMRACDALSDLRYPDRAYWRRQRARRARRQNN